MGFRKPEPTRPQRSTYTPPASSQPSIPSDFEASNPDLIQEGMRVRHQKFGEGTVLSVDGAGANKKATVKFDTAGTKQLMLKFARLAILH